MCGLVGWRALSALASHWLPAAGESSQLISLVISDLIYFARCPFCHRANLGMMKSVYITCNFGISAPNFVSFTLILNSDLKLLSPPTSENALSFLLT